MRFKINPLHMEELNCDENGLLMGLSGSDTAAVIPDDKMDAFRQDPSYRDSVGAFQLGPEGTSCLEEQLTSIISDHRPAIACLPDGNPDHEKMVREFLQAHGIVE